MTACDVYSFGVVSSSTLYCLKDAFPAPEGYAEVDDVWHMTGGEAANSSIVLSRLGVRVRLDGNWIGDDDGGRRTKRLLDEHGIDSSRLPLRANYRGASEVVFAAPGTRTIFGTYGRLLQDRDWNMPVEGDVAEARAICLDPFLGEASERVAEIGLDAGVPVVTVDCPYDSPLVRHASAVVIAESFLRENYAERRLEELFQTYQAEMNGLLVFTFGSAAAWYARPGEGVEKMPAYPIDPVDTSGAGDSFRAGIVYGLLQGWGDRQMIRFASALAGMVCTRFPGVLNAPTIDEVREFMEQHRSAGN